MCWQRVHSCIIAVLATLWQGYMGMWGLYLFQCPCNEALAAKTWISRCSPNVSKIIQRVLSVSLHPQYQNAHTHTHKDGTAKDLYSKYGTATCPKYTLCCPCTSLSSRIQPASFLLSECYNSVNIILYTKHKLVFTCFSNYTCKMCHICSGIIKGSLYSEESQQLYEHLPISKVIVRTWRNGYLPL